MVKPGNTAVVTVRTPCTCDASAWYECRCSSDVAVYDCPPFDGMAKVPDPMWVAHIEALHPGFDLLYMRIGSAYQGHLESCRREVAHQKAVA